MLTCLSQTYLYSHTLNLLPISHLSIRCLNSSCFSDCLSFGHVHTLVYFLLPWAFILVETFLYHTYMLLVFTDGDVVSIVIRFESHAI
jgi:hypothetical protein